MSKCSQCGQRECCGGNMEDEIDRLRTAVLALVAGYYDDSMVEEVLDVVGDDAFTEAHRLGLIANYRDITDEYQTTLTGEGEAFVIAALRQMQEPGA